MFSISSKSVTCVPKMFSKKINRFNYILQSMYRKILRFNNLEVVKIAIIRQKSPNGV